MSSTLANLIKQTFTVRRGNEKRRQRNTRKHGGNFLLQPLENREMYTAAPAPAPAVSLPAGAALAAVHKAVAHAGNTPALGGSYTIGTLGGATQTFNDFVGTSDPDDYYSFRLTTQSNFALTLNNLSADADVELLDANGNRLAISQRGSNQSEAVSATLAAGNYTVHVYQYLGDTDYTLQMAAPATRPTPVPPSPNVSIHTRNVGSMTELDITGGSRNDSILVTQAGARLTIHANGHVTTLPINFSEIVIHGGAGNDSIRVANSVTVNARIYGDAGHDCLADATRGRATIVTIGGGADLIVGNGLNTNFWADTQDTIVASAMEAAAGGVHKISSFYQPYSTDPSNPYYVPLDLNGQNLADPTDIGPTTRLTGSFWGRRPTAADVNQGGVGDCYFLASLAGLANNTPNRLTSLAVDLGDGTYAVQFTRDGVTSVVRVDGDLSLNNATPGASGNLWAPIMEKAYAFFRYGQASYSSLDGGWMSDVMNDLNVSNSTAYATDDPNMLFGEISHALATGHAVTLGTGSIYTYAPLVGGHAYTIVGATRYADGSIVYTVRNPWGVDGVDNSSNPSDGLVTIGSYDLMMDCSVVTWAV